jgi:hypothetical protein
MFRYVYYLDLFQIFFLEKNNMNSSYNRMKDQLLSDTIPVSDRDLNEPVVRKRLLTRPRVRIIKSY